jgi:hypothetical protein
MKNLGGGPNTELRGTAGNQEVYESAGADF